MPPKDDDKPVELMAETQTKRKAAANGKKDDKKKGGKKKNDNGGGEIDDANAMSEEDRQLKERLETCVSTLINESNEAAVTPAIRLKAIDVIVAELRSATSSMTSVPKPLKFLRPKYDVLKGYYGSIVEDESVEGDREMVYLRARLGDVLAVLAMTLGKHGEFPHCHFEGGSAVHMDGTEFLSLIRIIFNVFRIISLPNPFKLFISRKCGCPHNDNDDGDDDYYYNDR
jgi:26S proteasome regulatory subunit N1